PTLPSRARRAPRRGARAPARRAAARRRAAGARTFAVVPRRPRRSERAQGSRLRPARSVRRRPRGAMDLSPRRTAITSYPTFGGSGIIATEVGLALAARGHLVHFIASATPIRLGPAANVWFHEVGALDYPLYDRSPYTLALASKMVEVCRAQSLDL